MAKVLGGVARYGLDTPIPLDKVLEVCGLIDTLWALKIVIEPADKEFRLLACDYAERVLPLFERQYPNDNRPSRAIEIARRFAEGEATSGELAAAHDAAYAAWAAAYAAEAAAWAAAREAAYAAAHAAWDAAHATRAAAYAAEAAAWAAAGAAAYAAAHAARDAEDAERAWQKQRLLKLLEG